MTRFTLWVAIGACAAARVRGDGGPYPPGPASPGSDAIPANSVVFKSWAQSVASFEAGPRRAGAPSISANYGSIDNVFGPPDAAGSEYDMPPEEGPVLSLGDGGRVTLQFSPPIADGEGADFAVFENGFAVGSSGIFAELAFVEVSSNGVDFVRFPAVSCTSTAVQTGSFTTLDPRNLHNLAGKHPAGYGTPFDLSELVAANPALNAARITHVRIVDVVGDVTGGLGSRDSSGSWINDPFPTDFQTCGFDLDAVGVIHQAQDEWQEWVAASFEPAVQNDPAITGPDADPDGDGKTNLVEYACGFQPSIAETAAILTVGAAGNDIVLQFNRDTVRTDVSLILQYSLDGLVWSTLASSSGGGTTTGTGVEISESGLPRAMVSVTASRTEGRRLYRLKVTRG